MAQEAGHAAENIFLEAQALGFGSVAIGAYDDDAVKDVVGLPGHQEPVLLIAVGHKSKN